MVLYSVKCVKNQSCAV